MAGASRWPPHRGPAPGRKPGGAGPLLFARPVNDRRGPEQTPPFSTSTGKQGNSSVAARYFWRARRENVDATTRKPTLLSRLSGLFLLRMAQRTLFVSLLNAPPRRTRAPVSLSHRRAVFPPPSPSQAD